MRSIRPHAVVCSLVWGMVLGTARADVPPDLAGQRIVEVSVEGPAADYVSAQDLGIPTNAVLSRDFVQALITKLMTSGAWIDVATYAERTEGGVHLYVDLTPRIVVVRVDLRGLDAMPKDDALRALALGEGTTLDGDILTRSEEALREAYVNIGYDAPLIRVTARETDDPGRRVVVVDVKEGAPTRVASLAWLGEKPNATLDARRAVRDLPGMVLDERELEARLRAAGESLRRAQYFEAHFVLRTVERDQTRAKVTVESHVGPQYTLEITGESPLSKGDVAEALNLEAEPLVPASEAAARERVRDLYRRLGYRFPTVEMETAPARQKGHAVLRVRIAKGAQEEVVAIAFPGATHFASDYLEGQLLSYLDEELPGSPFVDTVDSPVADRAGAGGKRDGERETPKPPNSDPRRTYYEPIYDEAIEHIADLYHSEGYLAAKVGPARLLEVDARRRVVSIPVVEGPRTFLQRVTLIGQDALTPRAVLTAAGLESRQPFSYVSLEKARVGIVDLYRDHGYYFVRVEPRVAFSRDRTRADVTFEIVEGFQV
ncbi:MAG: hypothetical protein KC417_05670, partial [Myxococcales bacterium]|nr:hypothetical protein [Myxococcales bacterium]